MKLAVFDFDGTLFPEDTLPFLIKQWRAQAMPLRRFIGTCASMSGMYARYRLGLYPGDAREHMRRMGLERFTRIFRGMDMRNVDAFFEKSAGMIAKRLNAPVAAEAEKAKRQGFHTVLLSGGYQRLLDHVGAALGFDSVIGTALHYTDGRVDVSKPLDIVSGADKLTHLRGRFCDADVDWQASTAYADSLSDLPLLQLVGVPVAVNPEPPLKAQAEARGWRILIC